MIIHSALDAGRATVHPPWTGARPLCRTTGDLSVLMNILDQAFIVGVGLCTMPMSGLAADAVYENDAVMDWLQCSPTIAPAGKGAGFRSKKLQ